MQDRNGAKNCIACEEVDGIGRVDEHPQMRMDDVDADTDVQHRPSRLIGELRLDGMLMISRQIYATYTDMGAESGGDAVAQLLLANNRNRMQPITTRVFLVIFTDKFWTILEKKENSDIDNARRCIDECRE
jgi:hypothetical protein